MTSPIVDLNKDFYKKRTGFKLENINKILKKKEKHLKKHATFKLGSEIGNSTVKLDELLNINEDD